MTDNGGKSLIPNWIKKMSRDIRVQCKNKIDGAKWWICKGFGIDRIQVKFMSHKIIQWSIVHVEKCRDTQTSSNTVIAFLIIWLSFLGHWSKLQTQYIMVV
jgi:hypothetical protein